MLTAPSALLYGVLDVQECTQNALLNVGFGLTLEPQAPPPHTTPPPSSVLVAHVHRVPMPRHSPLILL